MCEFQYLGVLQRSNATATVACNASSKLAKAELFKRNILCLCRLVPDRVSVYVAREFLCGSGDGRALSLSGMALKGYALLDLHDSFFMKVH